MVAHHAAGRAAEAPGHELRLDSASVMIGRVAASVMMTTTNIASVKFTESLEVVANHIPACGQGQHNAEDDAPESEDHFDLAEKVHQLRTDAGARVDPTSASVCVESLLHVMRTPREARRGKRCARSPAGRWMSR